MFNKKELSSEIKFQIVLHYFRTNICKSTTALHRDYENKVLILNTRRPVVLQQTTYKTQAAYLELKREFDADGVPVYLKLNERNLIVANSFVDGKFIVKSFNFKTKRNYNLIRVSI